jgi:hypothetical protein
VVVTVTLDSPASDCDWGRLGLLFDAMRQDAERNRGGGSRGAGSVAGLEVEALNRARADVEEAMEVPEVRRLRWPDARPLAIKADSGSREWEDRPLDGTGRNRGVSESSGSTGSESGPGSSRTESSLKKDSEVPE